MKCMGRVEVCCQLMMRSFIDANARYVLLYTVCCTYSRCCTQYVCCIVVLAVGINSKVLAVPPTKT
jgi:hypothetical protein